MRLVCGAQDHILQGFCKTERVHTLCASKAKSPENEFLETDPKRLACLRTIQMVNNTAHYSLRFSPGDMATVNTTHHSLRFSPGDMAIVEMEKNLNFNGNTFYKK